MSIYSAGDYNYLATAKCLTVDGVNDAQDFAETRHAMDVIGITPNEQYDLFKVLSAILNLGNLAPRQKGQGTTFDDQNLLAWVAALLEVDASILSNCLTTRTMETGRGGNRGTTYNVPLNYEQVRQYCRRPWDGQLNVLTGMRSPRCTGKESV